VGDWRKLHNEEHNNLYALTKIINVINSRRIRWAGHVVFMGEMRNVYNILAEKPERKRPLRRLRGDSIRMKFR